MTPERARALWKPVSRMWVGLGPRALSSRARKSCGLAAVILLLGCEGLQTATADGDTRTLSMHHMHTDENITITFKRNGRYDDAALKKLNWFLRDWRREQDINMDPHLFDLIWEVSREVDAQKPIEVVCGYRSPQTNAMLRRRSGGVARFSQHMLGRAMDFYVPGAELEDLRVAGLRLQRGGVGYYPTSGSPFVHLDTGSVRHWPRMTREQLVRVFPDGRTVHVPSDGRPLAGYALAMADIEKRGSSPSSTSLDAARTAGVEVADKPNRNLLASLFGLNKDKDEDEENDSDSATTSDRNSGASGASRPQPAGAAPAPRQTTVAASSAKAKPPSTFALASAPAPSRPAQAASLASVDSAKDSTASIGPAPTTSQPRAGAPWSSVASIANSEDEDPLGEGGLAYAAQHETQTKSPAARAAPMGAAGPSRNYAVASLNPAGATSVLPKSTGALPALPQPALQQPPAPAFAPLAPPAAPARAPIMTPAKVGDAFDDPWMRALVVAPDLQNYMTVTSFETPDLRQLRPLMEKPLVSVKMTFSTDPQHGMASDHFSGSAVVFLSTVNFVTRTASLSLRQNP
jgi:uncharacterized protein YcbK (DUF882 family)